MNNYSIKSTNIPAAVFHQGLTKSFIYNGPSMRPTFRPGQILYIRPYVQDLQPGDVIVYKQKNGFIVHRLLSVVADGFVTCGDNNRLIDPEPVTPEQIMGRVEMAEDRGSYCSVQGGWRGLWSARLRWLTMRMSSCLRYIFGWPYRFIKAKRYLARWWKPSLTTICLQIDNGPLYKYLYHNKTVATWNPSLGVFQCRKPFDLVIYPPLPRASY